MFCGRCTSRSATAVQYEGRGTGVNIDRAPYSNVYCLTTAAAQSSAAACPACELAQQHVQHVNFERFLVQYVLGRGKAESKITDLSTASATLLQEATPVRDDTLHY